jgi:F0F1-type ATP synthase membrane subunit b/b'
MTPGVSIVVSFLGFAYIFAKKVYPTAIKALDGHIESIKNKIKEAELLKEEATLALEEAYAKKEGIARLVEENKKASEERIERLRLENERYLKALREKFAYRKTVATNNRKTFGTS